MAEFVFADDYTKLEFSFISPKVSREVEYVHLAMALACTSAVLTWVTFYSNIGLRLYNAYLRLIPSSRFLRGDFDSKRLLFIVAAAIARGDPVPVGGGVIS